MSHNKITAQGQAPDSSGNIDLSLTNLSNVSTAGAALNQHLEYDGAEWSPATSTATGMSLYAGIFQRTSYSVGAYYYSLNDYRESIGGQYVHKYNASAFNTASSANTPIGNNNWFESFDVTAGTYWVQIGVTSNSNYGESSTWQLHGNNGAFSSRRRVERRNYGAASSCILSGIYTATGADIIRAVLVSHTQWTRLEHSNMTWFTGHTIVKLG